MNIKNNKKAQESIKKIKTTLTTLLKDYNINDIKIKFLCETAKVNRTTFYSHFDTVEDVLYKICEEYIKQVYQIFLNVDAEYKDRLKQGLIIIKNNIEKFKYFFTHVHDIEKRIIDIIEEDLKDSGVYNEKYKLALAFRISGLVGLGKTYLNDIESSSTSKLSIDELTNLIYSIFNTTT